MKTNWIIPVIIVLLAIIGYQAYNQNAQIKRIEKLESSLADSIHSRDRSAREQSGDTLFPGHNTKPDLDPFGFDTDPFADMERMRERMDDLVRESFGTGNLFGMRPILKTPFSNPIKNPSIDVKEENDQFVIVVTQVDPKSQDIEAKIDGQRLTLNFATKESTEENKSTDSGSISTFSNRSQTYSTSVELSEPVNVSSMQTRIEEDRIVITVDKTNK